MKKLQDHISAEHALYLKGLRRKSIFVQLTRIGLLAALLCLWELVAFFQLVDPFIISSPSRICKMIGELAADGSLFYHIGTTLWETLAGFAIAVCAGTGIALLLWWSEGARRVGKRKSQLSPLCRTRKEADLNFTHLRTEYTSAFTIAAATLEPPFLPRATI